MSTCAFTNCERDTGGGARGWCSIHYHRWRRHGDPAAEKRARASLFDRFCRYTRFGPGCWEWQGTRNPLGYGVIGRGGRGTGLVMTHRYMWELAYGPIPEGMCVLHKCDNPPCFRLEHLWLGTRDDNNKDMMAKGRHWRQREAASA